MRNLLFVTLLVLILDFFQYALASARFIIRHCLMPARVTSSKWPKSRKSSSEKKLPSKSSLTFLWNVKIRQRTLVSFGREGNGFRQSWVRVNSQTDVRRIRAHFERQADF